MKTAFAGIDISPWRGSGGPSAHSGSENRTAARMHGTAHRMRKVPRTTARSVLRAQRASIKSCADTMIARRRFWSCSTQLLARSPLGLWGKQQAMPSERATIRHGTNVGKPAAAGKGARRMDTLRLSRKEPGELGMEHGPTTREARSSKLCRLSNPCVAGGHFGQ